MSGRLWTPRSKVCLHGVTCSFTLWLRFLLTPPHAPLQIGKGEHTVQCALHIRNIPALSKRHSLLCQARARCQTCQGNVLTMGPRETPSWGGGSEVHTELWEKTTRGFNSSPSLLQALLSQQRPSWGMDREIGHLGKVILGRECGQSWDEGGLLVRLPDKRLLREEGVNDKVQGP